MTEAALRDPFSLTPDIRAYVPRPETERALSALLRSVEEGRAPTAVTGPPGLGKTLLLYLLLSRLPDPPRTIYVPVASMARDDLALYLLRALEAEGAEAPADLFSAYVAHLREIGKPLLLRVDDVTAMPLPTARWLGDLAAAHRPALRLVVAATDGPAAGRTIAALGPRVNVVRLVHAMTEAETHRYVAARLAYAGVPDEVLDLFDEKTVDELHRISGGIPRRLHAAASAVMRGVSPSVYEALEEGAPEPPQPAETPAARDEAEQELQRLRTLARRPPERRVEPPPSLRRVLATALAVVAAIGALGLVRSLTAAAPPLAPSKAAPAPGPDAAPPGETAATAAETPPVEAGPPSAAAAAAGSPVGVNINATPWAEIEVDGIPLGATPLADVPLLPGAHTIRAHMPDGTVLERAVEIDADNRFFAFP